MQEKYCKHSKSFPAKIKAAENEETVLQSQSNKERKIINGVTSESWFRVFSERTYISELKFLQQTMQKKIQRKKKEEEEKKDF